MVASSRHITVLFWDIDGTLLTTGRAGVFALEQATREVCHAKVDLQKLQTAGLTDAEIAARILERYGIADTGRDSTARFLEAYERHLPERLHWRRGRVLPGVHDVLAAVRDTGRVLNLLLTGNTRAGAAAKLSHYGIAEYFDGGAFCLAGDDRAAIAARALTLAEERLGAAPSLDRTYVIGDTPHDVRCGRAIGARTVAVATGNYQADELRACGPDVVLDGFPAPDAFLQTVGLEP